MSDSPWNRSRSKASRVLIVTPDTLGARMGGPAIRAWEVAKRLHAQAEVRLVSIKGATLEDAAFPVLCADEQEMRQHVAWADVLIGQGEVFSIHPWIIESDIVVVVDAYDPLHLEVLESGKDEGEESRKFLVDYCVDMLNIQLQRADYVICASEKQRDFWLGHLAALGRISPENYDRDRSLRALIDVVPFGVSDDAPVQTRHPIRDSVEGISSNDKLILWGGGIYNWFDPLTLITAVDQLSRRRPEVRLYFLGMTYPNSNVRESNMSARALRLADELSLTGSHVFFNMDWVDYEDRINYLLEADVAVSTHSQHIETDFSFRTRILDYLWAGLPIVATDGDGFAPIIREHRLGAVVPPQNAQALADALETVIFDGAADVRREKVRAFASQMTWDTALRPLLEFMRTPAHAADYPDSRDKALGGHRRRHIESLQAKILELDQANNEMVQKIRALENGSETHTNQ